MNRGFVTCFCVAAALVAAVMLANSTGALAQPGFVSPEIHCEHFLHGMPLGAPATSDLIFRDLYALSSNDDTKFADWVCYHLTPREMSDTVPPRGAWYADPFLDPDETLEPNDPSDDYTGASKAPTKYDRGHLAPFASFAASPSLDEVNSYANIAPMRSSLNRGPWSRLEAAVRSLAVAWGDVWVVCGPLYEDDMLALPECDEEHTVPSGFWQVVAVRDGSQTRAAAFVMSQTQAGQPYKKALARVDDVETRSGLDLFSELPAAEEAALESARPISWVAEW